MSWQASKAVWRSSKQTGGLKLTLLAIADFASPQNEWTCEAAIETLAEMVGVTDRQIKKNLKALEAAGELEVCRQVGRGNTNVYSLSPLIKGELEDIKGEPEDTINQPEKVNPSTEKVNSRVLKGEPEDTQTNITNLTNKNNNSVENMLIGFFEGMTGFTQPHDTTDMYADDWLGPVQAIISQSASVSEAEKRLTWAIQEMRRKRYTIKSPKSCLTMALNWQESPPTPTENGRQPDVDPRRVAMENIRKAVTTIGAKRYRDAMATLTEDERAIVKRMAPAWLDVCSWDKNTFEIRYWQALKEQPAYA